MRHLLVTNDFPPKVGGIQTYLWELWRRLDPNAVTVLATPHAGAADFDAAAPFEIRRTRDPVLLPHPALIRQVNRLAAEVDADLVVLDPALPLGAIGPALDRPYGLVLHGAEITLPGRLPLSSGALGAVLRRAMGEAASRYLTNIRALEGVLPRQLEPLQTAPRRASEHPSP